MGTIVGFCSLLHVFTTKVAISGKCWRIWLLMERDLSFRLLMAKETQAYMSINDLLSSSTYYFSLGMAKYWKKYMKAHTQPRNKDRKP